MAEINIFPETTFPSNQFRLDALFNLYMVDVAPAPFKLEVGKKYKVIWDGIEYECEGQDASAIVQTTSFAIGNGTAFGLVGNNEPFVIQYMPDMNNANFASLTDTEPTEHTVAIYEKTTSVVLKDRNGQTVEYPGIDTLKIKMSDGTTKDFTNLKPIETVVDIDFSEGDMTIVPKEKEVFNKVNIPKPTNLIPENIAEGANVAGVIGTHSGGGGLDLEGDFLKYIVYQIDDENKEIIICGILYSQLYADTGSYDVNIPANFGAYSVVINPEGVI